MAVIDQYRDILTVLVEFDIDPTNCDEHIRKIKEFFNNVVRKQPGFISANLHLSLDKKKVINYAQWKNEDFYNEFLNNEEVQSAGKMVLIKDSKSILMKVAFAS